MVERPDRNAGAVRRVSFAVDAPSPTREHAGRCADRRSPNAMPLFRAAAERVAEDPGGFPIREGVGVIVTSSDPMPDRNGYGAIDPIVEVLVDAGVLEDERQVRWERVDLTPGAAGYAVVLEIDRPG